MNTLDPITDLLNQIDPAKLEYDEWLKVGAAIKHEGGSVELWDSWSRADGRYRSGDCVNRWAGLDKGAAPVTIATLVQYCKDQGGTPPRTDYISVEDPDAVLPLDQPTILPGKRKSSDESRIVRREWLEIQPIPNDDGTPGHVQLIRYLRALFSEEDHVGYQTDAIQTEPDAEGKQRWVPHGRGMYSETAGELIRKLERCGGDMGCVIGDWPKDCGAWIRFNPLDGKGASDSNVMVYRYALVESDELPVDEQWSIIRKLELPVAAIVHSGKKSIHAIVKIDAPDYKTYQQRVDVLYDICKRNGLPIDRKNRNPSRFSRMPGVDRAGQMQRLLATDIGQQDWATWIDWIQAVNDDLPEMETLSDIWENIPDLSPCLIDGVLRMGHKMLISGPSKAGKSFLLLELAIAIAEGKTWLGWQCHQGRVCYVNLELDRASCLHRLKDIYESSGIRPENLNNIELWNLRGKSLPMTELAPKLIRRAVKKKLSAIIIDPIYKVITGDENSADQMAKFCNQFDKVCTELGCAVIYCHHHSKGDQGQKRAQDRASGSGVFARDPDVLIDMVELEINDQRREQILYKYKVKALQGLMDSTDPHWRDTLDQEDADKLEVVIAKAREISPDADKINCDEHYAASTMTGWRIGGILREFPAFPDRNVFFHYPVHDSSAMADLLLTDCHPSGYRMTRDERAKAGRQAREERAKAGRQAGIDTTQQTIDETRMAFDALDDGTPVTTARICEYLNIKDNAARSRLRNAGFKNPDGVKGVWIQ